jgi:ClpP class serine protease
MGRLSALWRLASNRYASIVLLSILGIGLGYAFFFFVYPQKPKIGVIDIPFTVINDRSASTIVSYLEYARSHDEIKGVVIRLTSPGGGASASERLFLETRNLRDEMPVVLIMGDLVASGGFMMSMGANYLYTRPSSLVGNVGVIISFPGPVIPPAPIENIVVTGPDKLFGGDRRDWITMADQMKRTFAGIVISERGDSLKVSHDELLTGRVFPGMGAVNLGLADAIGSDQDAIEKAAELAGISHYGLVDINSKVQRESNELLRWVFDPLLLQLSQGETGGQIENAPGLTPFQTPERLYESFNQQGGGLTGAGLESLRNILPYGGVGPGQEEALPGFPQKVNTPNIYYLYVGPSQ